MKNIVLCSDGTGNKGGYGADTNVYKTYKAVDVSTPGVDQYTFYDQGVGTDKSDTSKNKYMTALSGAFGIGFRNNVLHLYHFLARSYDPGDAIFLFGFSRGAATIRAFAGFINACGLLDRNHPSVQTNGTFDSDKFQDQVCQAFKCYRSKDINAQQNFKNQYAVKDNIYAPNGELKIKFIGVWDTVSALGFPKDFSIIFQCFFAAFDKITDQIPRWAHNFYDYGLNNSIENAYHALSIDDERTTFHPLIWDETSFSGHVEQVWFAGVHSNVGGGYPRTGLSDVTLLWMLSKAAAHGLIFHPDNITAIQDSANIYDKLYDSRDGVAMYYRYGPRYLTELCKNKLNSNITIHLSAYKKIKEISDSYAPDGIPCTFDVVDIDPQNPALSSVVHQVNVVQPTWNSLENDIDKVVKSRKNLYSVFVELTMLILVISGLFWLNPPESITELNACEVKQMQMIQIQAQENQEGCDLKSIAVNPFFAYAQTTALIPQSGDYKKCSSITEPDFCKKANHRPLKWLGDMLRYVTPSYFENFITYVTEVHWWMLIAMLSTLFYLSTLRKRCINKLDAICRQLSDLI